MSLSLVSFSYKTTPLDLREKLAIPANVLPELVRQARMECGMAETMAFSTCNRVEFYGVAGETPPQKDLLEWMRVGFPGWDPKLEAAAVQMKDDAALTHLFRVAASLESMVIGEPQILGQVKDGYSAAVESGAAGTYLNGLMQRVFRAAKRVRTETEIARNPVSISYVAAELAGRIFDDFSDVTVMVVGAGEMAELVIKHLQKSGAKRLVITNRTFANAVSLAERFQGDAVQYGNLAEHLAEADIVISSTGAPDYVITEEMTRKALKVRRGRPLFLIDIAVPRDIDPAVDTLSDVYCYDIDDLQDAADQNKKEREVQAVAAQEIIDQEVARFLDWKRAEGVVPVLKALRGHFSAVGEGELKRTLAQLGHLGAGDREAVERAMRSLVNKLLHTPSTRLKALGTEPDGLLYANALSTLFELEPGAEEPAGSAEGLPPNVVPISRQKGG